MPPDDPHRSRPVTVERLGQLLDAYGAAPERWPDTEREAAGRLVERSVAARRRRDEAADLDRLLDTMRIEPPPSALAARVLAAAPRPRALRRWRPALVVAVPLAAAAAVTLWVVRGEEPVPRPTGADLVAIGEYTSPTDVLLEPYGIDVYATVPSVGCTDSVLGCPRVEASGGPVSQRRLLRRVRA